MSVELIYQIEVRAIPDLAESGIPSSDKITTMTAANRFENLSKTIEESNLNYSIHKTPFSATISLKCSFVKRFSNIHDDSSNKSHQFQQNSDGTEKLEFEQLKKENDKFKKELSELRDRCDTEKSRLEDLYRSEKQIVDLREEVLDVKREKHKMSADLKLVKSSLSASEIETNQLNLKVVSVEKVLKDKVNLAEAKDAEIADLKVRVEELQQVLDVANEKLSKTHTKSKKENQYLSCNSCDFKVKSIHHMKDHVRKQHSQSKACQYKIEENSYFESYPCFYCEKVITSKEELEEHYITCSDVIMMDENDQEVPDQFYKCYYSCDMCIEKFSCLEDLGGHRSVFHGLGALKMRHPLELYDCDICPLIYNTELELEDHVESCHMDFV